MVAFPYDIKFTVGGNEYGFMLVSPKGATKQLELDEAGGPAVERIKTEATITHQDFAPELDTPFSQISFTGGLGQLEFDGKDDTRYWWSRNIVTHVPGRAHLSPLAAALTVPGSTTRLRGFRSYLGPAGRFDFCWDDTNLYRRSAANNTNNWVSVGSVPAPATDFQVFAGGGVLAFPTSGAATDYATATGLDGTYAGVSRDWAIFSPGTKPKYFIASRGVLYAAVDNGKVYWTVDPTQDAWVGPITTTVGALSVPDVGDRTYPFMNAIAVNDYVFFFTQNAGYSIDSDQNVREVFWQWKNNPSDKNFKFVATSGELLFYTIGTEIYAYDPGTGANVPLKISQMDGVPVEEIVGMAADSRFLYALVRVNIPNIRTEPSIAVLRARRTDDMSFAIECIWEDTTITGHDYWQLGVVPNGSGSRVYMGNTTGGQTVTYSLDLPATWDESVATTSFNPNGDLYTSITAAAFPGFAKRHLWTGLETENTSATETVAVAYSTDGGKTFTALGDTGAGGAEITRLPYTNISSQKIILRFTLNSGGAETPILRVFDHHQRVRFRLLRKGMAALRLADNVETMNGTRDGRTQAQLNADLETLRKSDTVIAYEDFLGNSFNITVDRIRIKPTRHEGATEYETEAQILFYEAEVGG